MHQLCAPLCLSLLLHHDAIVLYFLSFFPFFFEEYPFASHPPTISIPLPISDSKKNPVLHSHTPKKMTKSRDIKKKEKQARYLLSFQNKLAWPPRNNFKKTSLVWFFFFFTCSGQLEKKGEKQEQQGTGKKKQRQLVVKKDSKNERKPITRVIKNEQISTPFLSRSKARLVRSGLRKNCCHGRIALQTTKE